MADEDDLNRQLDRLERRLPAAAARPFRRLRRPGARWVRLPVAVLLVLGGTVGFLPILGFWMIPVGLLLLSQDVPALRRPTARAIAWVERRLDARAARRGR